MRIVPSCPASTVIGVNLPFAARDACRFSIAEMPTYSAPVGLIQKFADFMGINRRFHKEEPDKIDTRDLIVSPVQAEVMSQGGVEDDGTIISKGGKKIPLEDFLHKDAELFSGGYYMNLYLRPSYRHYWRVPYDGSFISTHVNKGKAVIPIFIGLESFFKNADLFPKAVKKNASIASVLMTADFPLAMIAVGSLCVNGIHVIYSEGVPYKKGDVAGYFTIGSSMLLVYPKNRISSLVETGRILNIGEALAVINAKTDSAGK